MRRELTKAEVERLFAGAVDEALPDRDAVLLEAELAADPALKQRFESYQRAVSLLRKAPKEKAPDALASMILRRARRRRFGLRVQKLQDAHRFPMEIVIPILLAVAVAVFLLLASP